MRKRSQQRGVRSGSSPTLLKTQIKLNIVEKAVFRNSFLRRKLKLDKGRVLKGCGRLHS